MIDDVSEGGRPVAAVERAIAVLDVLADGAGPRGVNELARALGSASEHGLAAARDARGGGSGRARGRLGSLPARSAAGVLGQRGDRGARPARARASAARRALGADRRDIDAVARRGHRGGDGRLRRELAERALAGAGRDVRRSGMRPRSGRCCSRSGPDALAALPAELERFTECDHRRSGRARTRAGGGARSRLRRGERRAGGRACTRSPCPCSIGRGELAAILGLQGPDRFDAAARACARPAARSRRAPRRRTVFVGYDQGYGELETGCRSPVAKRSKRNG